MDIANRIIQYRKLLKMSQEELADKINVSRQTITKWEREEAIPGLEYVISLSEVFEISIDRLVKESECFVKEESTTLEDDFICFLVKAKKKTYAAKKGKTEATRLNSHDYIYKEEDLMYHDSFVGSEKFSGEEVVYKKENPIFSMNYYGRVINDSFSGDFLKEALLQASCDHPFRGPLFYTKGHYTYVMKYNGDKDFFLGEEEIYYNDSKVYECLFHGGILK